MKQIHDYQQRRPGFIPFLWSGPSEKIVQISRYIILLSLFFCLILVLPGGMGCAEELMTTGNESPGSLMNGVFPVPQGMDFDHERIFQNLPETVIFRNESSSMGLQKNSSGLYENGLSPMSDIGILEMNGPTTELSWAKCFGGSSHDYGHSIIQTLDGGYLVGGDTYSNDGDVTGNHGRYDYWLAKLSSVGRIQWQQTYGGSKDDSLYNVIQTTDGGYLVGGDTYSNDGDVTGNHGNSDYWIIKLDPNGSLLWQKCFGGSSDDLKPSIIQTTDGGYLVAGRTESNDGDITGHRGSGDYWVVKLDSSGSLVWEKCFGGSGDEYSRSVIQTTDGGYLVGGDTNSNDGDVTGNHGGRDIWVVKLDSSGNLMWERCLGGSNSEYARSVIQTTDGGYLVAGYTNSNDGDITGHHGSGDYWVVKLDSSGSLVWEKCLGGSNIESAYSAIQTTDGGYLIGGYSHSNNGDVTGNHGSSDYWIVKLDSSGSLVWEKCYGGSSYEFAYSLIQTTDNRYAVLGYTYSNDGDVIGNHGFSDLWAILITARHPINSSDDQWTIIHPYGNRSYLEGTDATYITQAKPGAVLEDVKVNSTSQGPVPSYTFSKIDKNHTISTEGSPVPGQVHVMFDHAPKSGNSPLQVYFFDRSVGTPNSWFWQFGDGGTSTEKDPVHQYTYPGSYTVSLRAYNDVTGGYYVCNDCVEVVL